MSGSRQKQEGVQIYQLDGGGVFTRPYVTVASEEAVTRESPDET